MQLRPLQCRDCGHYTGRRCLHHRIGLPEDTAACEHFQLKERYYDTHVKGYEAVV